LTAALSGGRSAGEARPLPPGAVSTYVRQRRSLFGGVDMQIDKQYLAGVLIVAARACRPCQRRTDR